MSVHKMNKKWNQYSPGQIVTISSFTNERRQHLKIQSNQSIKHFIFEMCEMFDAFIKKVTYLKVEWNKQLAGSYGYYGQKVNALI